MRQAATVTMLAMPEPLRLFRPTKYPGKSDRLLGRRSHLELCRSHEPPATFSLQFKYIVVIGEETWPVSDADIRHA